MFRSVKVLMLLASMLAATGAIAANCVTIKFATVAPEGSSWMNILKQATDEVKAKTGGCVQFKLYGGGIAGDEPDVIKKMRAGQYHGAGFTGVGMGEILPDSRIMEVPFFYKSVEEVDYVQSKLTPYFEKKFADKGYTFISWAEPGLVYLLSQRAIHSIADFQQVKLWVWEGDPLAEAIIKAFKISPVPIALPDVLMSLQTGMLNAVYAPPLASMALQWHTKVKYMVSEPITNSTGAVIIAKSMWDKISPEHQAIVRNVMKPQLEKLKMATRQQNIDAIAKFKTMGIKVENMDQKSKDEMMTVGASIRKQLVGKLYPDALLKDAEKYIAEFRSKKKK